MTAADIDTVIDVVLAEDLERLAIAHELEERLATEHTRARAELRLAKSAEQRTFWRLEIMRLERELGVR